MTFWSVCEILKTTILEFWDSFQLVESAVRSKTDAEDSLRTWGPVAQILLPIAALAIVWGQKGFASRFFLQFDKNCVSVFCPSFSKRERLLKWASGRLPPTWSSHANTLPGGPSEFWRDGSLLCTLINSAIPGACPNPHRHWRKPPSHGQALAYKYLGIPPVFTEQDFIYHNITSRQERILFDYLVSIQQAITKISLNDIKYSSRYAARGMGLAVGEQLRKTSFYIYSSSTTSSSKHDVLVCIRGPYNSYCTATIPAHYVTKKHIRSLQEKKKLAYQSRTQKSFFRSLSVDLGFFININQKSDLNTIPIKLVSETDRVKVIFIPKTPGIHEVSIITNGFHLVGSPFNVNVVENSSGVIDTFDENPFRRSKRRTQTRKIISKIIDFIDEKINYDSIRAVPSYLKSFPRIMVNQEKTSSECPDKICKTAEESYNLRQKAQDKISIKEKIDEEPENENNELFESCTILNLTQEEEINVKSKPTSPVGDYLTENEVDNLLESPEVSKGNPRTRILQRQRRINLSSDEYESFTAIPQKKRLSLSKSYSETSSNNDHKNQKPRSNSLNILNYLSSLKCEEKHFETSHLEPSLSDRCHEENMTIKQRLHFWEKRNSFNISSKHSDSSFLEQENKPSNIQIMNASSQNSESSLTEKHKHKELVVQRMQFWEKQNSLNISSENSDFSFLEQETLPSSIEIMNTSPKSSESSLTEKHHEQLMVQQRMKFWENQNFNYTAKPRLKSPQSLPDLLPSSEIFYRSNSLDFKMQFKERQEYWKIIASHSLSNSSLGSSIYCLERVGKLNNSKTRRSLPNIFSGKTEDIYNELSFRDFINCDFFNSKEARNFKSTFKKRREFWEALSSKYRLFQRKSRTGSVEENCYDSGFFNGASNLSAESMESLRQHSDSSKFKLQYEEKKKFWESLSRQNSSNCSSDSGCKPYYLKDIKSFVRVDYAKLKELTKTKRITEKHFLQKGNEEHLENINLTDDVKQIQDTKRTKQQFETAKNYFVGLEKCGNLERSCK